MSDGVASADGNGNRVTLALLGQKLDALTVTVAQLAAEQRRCNEEHEIRLRAVEEWDATSKERWRQHEDDHRAIETKSRVGDYLAYIAAAVAAAVGIGIKSP